MKTNENINERIIVLMKYYNLNINSFSKRIGVDNNTILGKIVNNPDRKPSYGTIVRILLSFTGLNCRWLMLGEGEMFDKTAGFIPDARERLIYLTDLLKKDITEIAIKTNIPYEEFNSVLNEGKEPTIKMFTGILSAFPEVNSEWLYQNKGEIFKKENG